MAASAVVEDCKSCPHCLEELSSPIFQCTNGHSVCGTCFQSYKICGLCRAMLTTIRNYKLEELLSELKKMRLKAPCRFASRGCKYELNLEEKEEHEAQCKNRIYKCEGSVYGKWDCKWEGDYTEMLEHFRTQHRKSCLMKYTMNFSMRIKMLDNVKDIQIIDFNDGQQLFWYKYYVDAAREKVYWLFQYVGTKKQATNYFYEFEMANGPTRKIKVTELCESDAVDAHRIFESERCVALPFSVVKTYLDEEEEVSVRFRVMKMKREVPSRSAECSKAPTAKENSNIYVPRLPLRYAQYTSQFSKSLSNIPSSVRRVPPPPIPKQK